MSKIHSAIPLAQNLVKLCVQKSITEVVISPGSRNAPLTIEFSNHPDINSYSVVDERSAAFFALGMAQQLCKPVAVVCTSGSAMLNYYPAVAEAFYSDIPLVVLSADRPGYLIDIGDGQTIRQPEALKNHVLYSASLKSAKKNNLSEADNEYNEQEINAGLNKAIEEKGPVHINVPFDEPLYDLSERVQSSFKNLVPQEKTESFVLSEAEDFIENWNGAERKMVLTGVNFPGSVDQEYLDFLGEDPSTLVFTETTSNLYHDNFFSCIDMIIAPLEKEEQGDDYFKKLQPEVLVTFGGMVVSKKVKAFLRKYPPKKHYHIDTKIAYDTFFCLTKHFKTRVNSFFRIVIPKLKIKRSDYRLFWDERRQKHKQKREEYLEKIEYSDFKVFDSIFKYLPKNIQVQVSNSSAIRYTQLFDLDSSTELFCNRGTSGIDGAMSTAVGAAHASGKPTVFITGDLSFFYDSNALWNEKLPDNFKVILINNGGGGIFRILPGNNDTEYFEKFFETQHNLQAKWLAKMYDFQYQQVSNENELNENLSDFFKADTRQILEVFTPGKINGDILLEYFNFIR